MATIALPGQGNAALLPLRLHRFTVDEYERLGELGILSPGDRVELLEGYIVKKMTQHPPHAVAVDMVRDALETILPVGWRLREQKPIRMTDSEPEPDLVVIRGPLARYKSRHPRPKDIALVIEVADASLADDQGWKARVYAGGGIPVYWIVNLVEAKVEVYAKPKAGKVPAYADYQEFNNKAAVLVTIGGKELGLIAVKNLLP